MTRGLGWPWAIVACSCLALVVPRPAHAGFFDQLFGGFMQAPPVEGFDPGTRRPAMRRRVPRAIQAPDKPVLQATTDIMHDKTLRSGDAVMTKTGIRIFVGDRGDMHDDDDFTALDDARSIKRNRHDALASLDATRNDPLTRIKSPDTIASGRSSAVASPAVPGRTVVDQAGKTIRYVGP